MSKSPQYEYIYYMKNTIAVLKLLILIYTVHAQIVRHCMIILPTTEERKLYYIYAEALLVTTIVHRMDS